jgi:valyl-tRNA synthetase
MTIRCGISLTPDYSRERINTLRHASDESTRAFITLYGVAYRDRVVSWCERAPSSAG